LENPVRNGSFRVTSEAAIRQGFPPAFYPEISTIKALK
jgi:hypothetical protein